MMGFLQPANLRWGPAFRQPAQSCQGYFFLQVSEYLLDHHRIFNTGDDVHGRTNAVGAEMCRNGDLDGAAAFAVGFKATASGLSADDPFDHLSS